MLTFSYFSIVVVPGTVFVVSLAGSKDLSSFPLSIMLLTVKEEIGKN